MGFERQKDEGSLIMLMLIPLGVALLMQARYDDRLRPHVAPAPSSGLTGVFVLMLVLNSLKI